jgi:hypothetical protein
MVGPRWPLEHLGQPHIIHPGRTISTPPCLVARRRPRRSAHDVARYAGYRTPKHAVVETHDMWSRESRRLWQIGCSIDVTRAEAPARSLSRWI